MIAVRLSRTWQDKTIFIGKPPLTPVTGGSFCGCQTQRTDRTDEVNDGWR